MTNIAQNAFNTQNKVTVLSDGSKLFSSDFDNKCKFDIHRFDQIKFLRKRIKSSFAQNFLNKNKIDIKGNKIIFVFKAQSFLYQQIRIMVGSLLEVGLKNKNTNWISELIKAKDRSLAGPTVPSKGLILKEISY